MVPDPTSPDRPTGPAEPADGPPSPAELATTGGDTFGVVVLGTTLLLGGALVLLLSRALPGRTGHDGHPSAGRDDPRPVRGTRRGSFPGDFVAQGLPATMPSSTRRSPQTYWSVEM